MDLLYYKDAVPNFGDDLNPELWPAIAPQLFYERGRGVGFLGIGTLIGRKFDGIQRIHVFSSGAGYLPLQGHPRDARIWCVRGPRTASLLGLSVDKVITDGAILSPLIYPKASRSQDIVVVPHFETLMNNDWATVCSVAGMRLVDPMEHPKKVINDISSAKLVLTESLHGAIIADSFGIPWISFVTNKSFSLFKWADWTESVELIHGITVISPPSAEVLLRLGKPLVGAPGMTVKPDRQLMDAEIRSRMCSADNASSPSVARNARAWAKQFAKWSINRQPKLSKILGLSPDRTAEQLVKLADENRPNLSKPSVRNSLTDRMLVKLDQLCMDQGVDRLNVTAPSG